MLLGVSFDLLLYFCILLLGFLQLLALLGRQVRFFGQLVDGLFIRIRLVAQFSTFSYPYWGYGLLIIIFVCMMLALLIRRKQLREGSVE